MHTVKHCFIHNNVSNYKYITQEGLFYKDMMLISKKFHKERSSFSGYAWHISFRDKTKQEQN